MATERIRPSIMQFSRIDIIRIWIQWHQLTVNWIKHQLVQERVVSSEECIDVVRRDLEGRHLQQRWHLLYQLPQMTVLIIEKCITHKINNRPWRDLLHILGTKDLM